MKRRSARHLILPMIVIPPCTRMPFSHQHFHVRRQQHIGPGTELDQSEAFAKLDVLTRVFPTDDSPRQDTGNLFAHDRDLFALESSARFAHLPNWRSYQSPSKTFPGVGNVGDISGNRRAIDMNIQRRKKNTNQRWRTWEPVVDCAYASDAAVGRRDNCVVILLAVRASGRGKK